MGTKLHNDELAIQMSTTIPRECKRYVSHHVRNGLASILGLAERIKDDPIALKELQDHIWHITRDLEKIGM